MKRNEARIIQVWADWEGLGKPRRMGSLTAAPSRGKELFYFEYEAGWLASGYPQMLDPLLLLVSGAQYATEGKPNFGMFLDSSPDRWGRFLMDRREAQLAREESRDRSPLKESDYLLGVFDGFRMGALRFRLEDDGAFLDDNRQRPAPPFTSLRELEQASLEIQRTGSDRRPDYAKWVRMLIAPGGSLGGARPKAGVADANGRLWIAKFPSSNDATDIGVWEYLAYRLALRAGIVISECRVEKYGSAYHTFLTKRVERTEEGGRRHFASAMTLLNRSDGDDASAGASYLELAEFLVREGAHTDRDLEQLWRRIVFFICISNVDDHLRNHGFILEERGWALSPAYDINPTEHGDGLKLNISDVDNTQDLELAMEVADFFRVNSKRALQIIYEVVEAVKTWRVLARSLGISSAEQESMERAFRIAESEK